VSTRKPVDLDSIDARAFVYDQNEDAFFDDDGKTVSPVQILDEMYNRHCRTLRLGFRIRWNIGSAARWTISRAVWRGQDAAMWAAGTRGLCPARVGPVSGQQRQLYTVLTFPIRAMLALFVIAGFGGIGVWGPVAVLRAERLTDAQRIIAAGAIVLVMALLTMWVAFVWPAYWD
jgi:hypothetical protein